ncbi:hypothetical protein TorRG33x02_161570 [Trema orientale]|uniref:Uncharacterized protein n=1 Tax=Trema orientale TaxID=63057 RepID=A0A2P5ERG7_TREOI|nr:hypothetical protein TorRG33x02_161570 [Trema orientale]
MATFRLPLSLCEELDSLARKFWWIGSLDKRYYLCLIAWDSICQPKARGGLGIRRFKDINAAFLAKLGWMMASDSSRFWISILKARYCRESNFWTATLPKTTSVVARMIWSTRDFIREGSVYLIGNGDAVDIWNSPWVPWFNMEQT